MAPPGTQPPSIKVRALQWLAQREHSHSELRGKLLRLLSRKARVQAPDAADDTDGGSAAKVDALLDWLTAQGHLSQERFTESRVHARQRRFGNLRIQHELKQHGLALDDPTRDELKSTEFQRAMSVWRKKFGQPAADATGRVRQMRFLTGRGFTPEAVRQVMRQVAELGAAAADAAELETEPGAEPKPG